LLLAGTALAGLVDYYAPSIFGLDAESQPTKRLSRRQNGPESVKVGHTSTEQQQLPPFLTGKQPATPCPSVEEYISPTFARNYQGNWRYVVQIPHQGYFTQTIQRTSCLAQKCQFTEGLCHEVPRWVSLLVAEIYYPNAVFGSSDKIMTTSEVDLQQAADQQQSYLSNTDPNGGAYFPAQVNSHENYGAYLALADSPSVGLPNDFRRAQNSQQDFGEPNFGDYPAYAAYAGEQVASGSSQKAIHETPPETSMAGSTLADPKRAREFSHRSMHTSRGESVQVEGQESGTKEQEERMKALAMETLRQNPQMTLEEFLRTFQLRWPGRAKRKRRHSSAELYQPEIEPRQYQMHSSPPFDTIELGAGQMENGPQRRAVHGTSGAAEDKVESVRWLRDDIHSSSGHQSSQQSDPLADGRPSPLGTPTSSLASSATTVTKTGPAGDDKVQYHSTSFDPKVATSMAAPNVVTGEQGRRPPGYLSTAYHNQPTSRGPTTTTAATATHNKPERGTKQIECDGFDKIGCYVVRVYYDWFLVNGSCKCWKTSLPTSGTRSGVGSSGDATSSSGRPSAGGGLIRRIFTG